LACSTAALDSGTDPSKPSDMLAEDASREDRMDATAMVSPAQHMRALQIANRVRLARSELKRRVASGELDAAEVITSCPWEARTMEIGELLAAQRRWGTTRCRNFLASVPMSEVKHIGTLTDRQRKDLAVRLSARAGAATAEPAPLWPAFAAA
jgi:hypothetical protein